MLAINAYPIKPSPCYRPRQVCAGKHLPRAERGPLTRPQGFAEGVGVVHDRRHGRFGEFAGLRLEGYGVCQLRKDECFSTVQIVEIMN
jgi:hypothetical protein